MQVTTTSTPIPTGELSPSSWPDHTQLPDSDDNFVKNFQEHPQSVILTTSINPLLDKIHPDKDYNRLMKDAWDLISKQQT